MKWTIPITLLLLAVPAPARVMGAWDDDPGWNRLPNLNGTWYMNGDEFSPCRIIQRRQDGRAEFINENGDRARGIVQGDSVFIPEWNDGTRRSGLSGRIRGDMIIWPNGTYWSR